jgi:hypothetical protein
MKQIWFAAAVVIFAALPALAQQAAYVYTPLQTSQYLAVTSASAVSLTVPTAARIAEICNETANARYRDDGTAPTTSAGTLIGAGASVCFQYSGSLTAIQFIAVNTSTTLDVSYYR